MAPSFQLSSLAIPPNPFGTIKGLSGNPGGELWAVADNGIAYRRPIDGGFVAVPGFSSGFADAYVAPDQAVFLVSTPDTMRTCLSNCGTFAAFTSYNLPPSTTNIYKLCGSSSTNVFAIGQRDVAGYGVLWHFDGANWSQLSNNLGLANPRGCFLRSDGVLFISGLKDILRWEQGAGTLETAGLDLSALDADAPGQMWNAISGAGDTMIAVGFKRRSLVRSAVTRTWTLGANPGATNNFYAVGLTRPDEGFAAGTRGPQLLYATDAGTVFTPTAVDPPAITSIHRILVYGPDELYFGGGDSSGPVIIRATR